MKKPSVAIISPALQESNSGNWQTARRWSLMLASHFSTRVLRAWDGARSDRALIALHARKSADSSKMECGAHVVMEAVCCGTPVLASRIDGNVGLLGDDYAGYFPVGDAAALARLLARCQDDPAWLALLQTQCSQRVPLFSPQREQRQLRALVQQNLI